MQKIYILEVIFYLTYIIFHSFIPFLLIKMIVFIR